MSSFLVSLSEKQQSKESDDDIEKWIIDHYSRCAHPFEDFVEHLKNLSENEVNVKQNNVITQLVRSFHTWKSHIRPSTNTFKLSDWSLIEQWVLKSVPISCIQNLVEIFEISKTNLLTLCRKILTLPIGSMDYKRLLNVIVQLHYQLEFQPKEILLPLIVNSKDHLLDTFLNKQETLEKYLIDLLNRLFVDSGRKINEILADEFQMKNVTVSRRSVGKLAVRYWGLYGHSQDDKYPNLAILQHKRTLGYLINVKYNRNENEQTMGDDAWNELVAVSF